MESLVCMTKAFTALRRILILTGSTVRTHIGCNWENEAVFIAALQQLS